MKIALLTLFFSASVFAADKPALVIEGKKLDLPEYENYIRNERPGYESEYKIQFSPKDDIMLSFFTRSKQPVLTTKDKPETAGLFYNVLFFSKEDGKLVNKVEWPAVGELDWIERLQYGSRIYPLPDNGYVGIFKKKLQVLDSSLNVVHDRVLERFPEQKYVYGIQAPSHGSFFSLWQTDKRYSGENEIIDSNTFKTVDRVSGGIVDIWGDKMLLVGFSDTRIRNVIEKKIGSSSDRFNIKIDNYTSARFVYNGDAVVLTYRGNISPPYAQHYWFTIENGKAGSPVFVEKGYTTYLVVARKAPVIAINVSKLRSFDRGDTGWINVYDINTKQILLQTKKYNDSYDFVLSSDGRSLALYIHEKRRIELYKIPEPGSKKK